VAKFPYLLPMFLSQQYLSIRDLNHLNELLANKPLHRQITKLVVGMENRGFCYLVLF
jgi:hypothetical protein